MKRKWIALIIIASLLTGAGGTYAGMEWLNKSKEESALKAYTNEINVTGVSKNQNDDQTNKLDKVQWAYDIILARYVEKVDKEKLVEGAIQGMLSTLKDPYSVYMNKEVSQQFDETLESSFSGIGAKVGLVNGKIVIESPFKGSPAEKAGLKANDQIVAIDGKNIDGLDLQQATMKIRGKKGTSVTLDILRTGMQEPLSVVVVRDDIPVETVFSKIKEKNGKKLGYVQITSFSEETDIDFKKQLKKLESQGIEGLILDVRGNPGGFLSSAEGILKELVTDKKPFVQIELRDGKKERYFSRLKEKKDYPIVVLIDKDSASASEILAGALKEAEGYRLVGETTFGKGTVQLPIKAEDGSSIKLTLYKWLTPDGHWIHQKGIKPDVPIKQQSLFDTHPIEVNEPLELDMNNAQVKNAQEILKGLGFVPGRTDGYFNEKTERSVKAFQLLHKLKVTGKIDKATAVALKDAAIEAMKQEKNDLQLQAAYALF